MLEFIALLGKEAVDEVEVERAAKSDVAVLDHNVIVVRWVGPGDLDVHGPAVVENQVSVDRIQSDCVASHVEQAVVLDVAIDRDVAADVSGPGRPRCRWHW